MVFYITSLAFREIIHRSITELDLICAGNECSNEIYLLKYVRENISRMGNLDEFIVDLNALQDTDTEIIQAFEMLRIMNYKTKIIIIASNRRQGDELLKSCFGMGLYNMILSDVFAEVYDELKYCLTVGKQYKDALRYKEGGEEEGNVIVKKELKRTVNKILVGITGSQARIGCTHLGIVIANYLRRKGYMVALLEYVSEQQSERKVFDEIQEAYQESLIDDRYFALNGIDYYAHVSNEELQQLLSVKFYNFIIVDYGLYQNCDKLMYSKCDIRLLVSGAKPWETAHIGRVFKDTEQAALQQMSFVFNFVADSDREDIRREMSGLDKVYFLPLSDNPFSSSDIGDMENIFAFYERQTTAETQRKKRSVMGFIRRKQSGKT